jgi:phosphopantothenate synthetase
MTQLNDLFKTEVLFSSENPFLKTAKKTHLQIADSLEKAARLQISFAEELLDLNRKRIDALYAGESFVDMISAQQDLATELGKRTTTWADELKEVVVDLQSGVSDATNELVSSAAGESRAVKGKKAKAA